MTRITGTSGVDTVSVSQGDIFEARQGDDVLTLDGGATGSGDEGNDTLIAGGGISGWGPTAWYWSARSNVYVDLAAGYALDGLGGRDTLVGIHDVHGFQRPGDVGLGTDQADRFWLGSWFHGDGTIVIDGRGGLDEVTLDGAQLLSNGGGRLVLTVSADGRKAWAHAEHWPSLVYELRNVETVRLSFWPDNNLDQRYDLPSLLDLSRAGQEILLREATGWQAGSLGQPAALTYSFLKSAPSTGAEGGSGFVAFNTTQQTVVREILDRLAQQTGLQFVEVADQEGMLRLGINQQLDTRGYSFTPDANPNNERAGDIWLDVETALLLQPGQEGYYVLLHELAHALGLQHPLPQTDTSGQTVLLDRLATFGNTVMIDLSASQTAAWPTWYGAFDLQALRALYGSKAYAAGDTVWTLTPAQTQAGLSLLDDGGTDTLDLSALGVSARIDLRPGQASDLGRDMQGKALRNSFSIVAGTWLENLVLTPFDDVATGNALDNRISSSGGNDDIDGQDGLDTVVLDGAQADWSREHLRDAGLWYVTNSVRLDQTLRLTGVERLVFDDAAVALDGDGMGGKAYRLYQAAYDRAPDPVGLGFWMYYLDRGFDLTQAADNFLKSPEFIAIYGDNPGNDQYVYLLYRHVHHREPDANGLQFWIDALDNKDGAFGKQWSKGEILLKFSESLENITNLIGVMDTGIVYTPFDPGP